MIIKIKKMGKYEKFKLINKYWIDKNSIKKMKSDYNIYKYN